MDRALDSGSKGWGFESLPVYQKEQNIIRCSALFLYLERNLKIEMQQPQGQIILTLGFIFFSLSQNSVFIFKRYLDRRGTAW